MLDLVLWVPNQHVCQVSLKSETVGFNSLGDLTQNDPMSHVTNPSMCYNYCFTVLNCTYTILLCMPLTNKVSSSSIKLVPETSFSDNLIKVKVNRALSVSRI